MHSGIAPQCYRAGCVALCSLRLHPSALGGLRTGSGVPFQQTARAVYCWPRRCLPYLHPCDIRRFVAHAPFAPYGAVLSRMRSGEKRGVFYALILDLIALLLTRWVRRFPFQVLEALHSEGNHDDS
jgi:hypothetical protein